MRGTATREVHSTLHDVGSVIMNASWPLILLTILAGAMLPLQAGVNARLGKSLGSPLSAALVSFGVGFVSLAIAVLVMRAPFGSPQTIKSAPVWLWTGGLMGALFVALSAQVAPRLGFALFIGLVIAGQLIVSVLLDHFGLLGATRSPVSVGKILGVLLLAVGVWLIRRG